MTPERILCSCCQQDVSCKFHADLHADLQAQLQAARENCELLGQQNTVAEALAVERSHQLARVRAVLVEAIEIAESGATDVTRSKRIAVLCEQALRELDAPEE